MLLQQEIGVEKLREIFTVGRIIQSLFVLFLTWFLVRTAAFILGKLADRWGTYRLQVLRFVPIVSTVAWSLSLMFIVILIFRPDETTVAALLGASAIAIGLALQDTLKNFFGGITILFDQPFQVGDKVEIGQYFGEIKSIGMRSVKLVTNDDSLVTVPNSIVVNQSVSNANSGALDFQVVTDVYLPAHTDVKLAEELAWQAAATSPYVYLNKPIVVLISDQFDDRPLTRVRIKAYVLDTRLETRFGSDVAKRAKKSFMKAGLLPEGFGEWLYQSEEKPLSEPPEHLTLMPPERQRPREPYENN